VALSIFPWEVTVLPPGVPAAGSARNQLPARVTSITRLSGRVRLGLDAGQPLAAEITAAALDELRLEVGSRVVATWKASATRLLSLE
jgi:molybdopterin-binding protein